MRTAFSYYPGSAVVSEGTQSGQSRELPNVIKEAAVRSRWGIEDNARVSGWELGTEGGK